MPKAKTVAKTLQEKMGFVDTDLRTPQHDAIMLWLDQNIGSIMRSRYMTEWPLQDVEGIKEVMCRQVDNMKRNIQEELDGRKILPDATPDWLKKVKADDNAYRQKRVEALAAIEQWSAGEPKPPVAIVTEKTWEYPIVAKNNYVVGFIDMKVVVSHDYELQLSNSSEYPYLPKWSNQFRNDTYYLEVKPTIPSVGELIRQVRLYQQHKGGIYMVVSPDDRFASIIQGQGIEFLKVEA